jgi:tetratricopeptide (TPR) repeat protein
VTRRIPVLVTLLALAGPGLGATRSPYQRGLTAFETRDFTEAEDRLGEVDPRQEPHAAFLLGVMAEQRKDYTLALARFDAFLSAASPRHDQFASAVAHRAYCLASAGRFAEAAAVCATASIDAADRTAAFLLAYADLLIASGASDPAARSSSAHRAATRFARLIATTEARNPDARNGLGLAKLSLGTPKDAAAELEAAVALDPRPAFLNNLGAARLALRDPAGARAAFERAAALATEGDPDHLRARKALARLAR